MARAIIDMNFTLLKIKNEIDSLYEGDEKEPIIDAEVEAVKPENTVEVRESDEWISY